MVKRNDLEIPFRTEKADGRKYQGKSQKGAWCTG